MGEVYTKYIEYIKNTGGNPKIEWFDEDWEPIGPSVRQRMAELGLTKEDDGYIMAEEDKDG